MSSESSAVFVTGGAGYVGSHCILELLRNNYEVVAVDNFSNSTPGKNCTMPESLKRVQQLTGKSLTFYKLDLLNKEDIRQIFLKHTFSCVVHFAALKAVGESCRLPLGYYRNNVGGSVNLLEVMQEFNVKKMVFSSSATVYGIPEYLPLDETHPVGYKCTSPYGRTKYFIEEILKDVCKSEKGWSVILLRYFNPVGAHESGLIGEDPNGIPNNLMPFIAQVAVGRLKELQVFGNDYKTIDGTGVRDYIHVMDLAEGHVVAVAEILKDTLEGYKVYNLGTGEGFSVLQVINAFQDACGIKIPYRIVGRREGDVDSMYADVSLAEKCLGWKAKRSLEQMCIQLRCSVRTRCKALFIYHHFQSCVSGMTYDPPLVAAACINLSVKSNGEKIELDAILMTFLCMFDKEKERKSTLKQEFKILKNSLIMMECLILRMTDFNLNHRLVHDYITYFLFDISHELTTMNLWNVICESCMKIASDFYFSDRCVCYKAEEIASATIQAAFYLAGIDVETECDRMKSWFKHVKECSKKLDIFEDIFKICMIGPVAESGK